jgi:hypothetical protein
MNTARRGVALVSLLGAVITGTLGLGIAGMHNRTTTNTLPLAVDVLAQDLPFIATNVPITIRRQPHTATITLIRSLPGNIPVGSTVQPPVNVMVTLNARIGTTATVAGATLRITSAGRTEEVVLTRQEGAGATFLGIASRVDPNATDATVRLSVRKDRRTFLSPNARARISVASPTQ